MGTWGRTSPASDLCLGPVNFHPMLLFTAGSSSTATICSPRRKGRIPPQTKPVTSLCFVPRAVYQLVFFGLSSRRIFLKYFRDALALYRLAGSLCLHQCLKLVTVLKTFPFTSLPYQLALSCIQLIFASEYFHVRVLTD